jgi:hypothetical protein
MASTQEPCWSFGPATEPYIRSWSYGIMETVADLYSPRIVGPSQAYRCECGTLAGLDRVGELCPECLVTVEADPALVRRRQLASVELCCICHHPITRKQLTHFPIAPIAFRLNHQGEPNALGKKYEKLIQRNLELGQSLLPPRTAKGFYDRHLGGDERVDSIVSDIVVGRESEFQRISPSSLDVQDSLLGLLWLAIGRMSPDVCAIARSCGFTLELAARI